jgi:hypothetical protein
MSDDAADEYAMVDDNTAALLALRFWNCWLSSR